MMLLVGLVSPVFGDSPLETVARDSLIEHRVAGASIARIEGGQLLRPTAPGLGLTLTPEMEEQYAFDATAVYSCMLHDWGPPPDDYWAR